MKWAFNENEWRWCILSNHHFLQRNNASPDSVFYQSFFGEVFLWIFFMFSSDFTQFVKTTMLNYLAAESNISKVFSSTSSIDILWWKTDSSDFAWCLFIYIESKSIMILTEIGWNNNWLSTSQKQWKPNKILNFTEILCFQEKGS